jgi:hypothetical protein
VRDWWLRLFVERIAHAAMQIKEFRAEVDIMATMRHVNIVQFVGACTKVPPLPLCFPSVSRCHLFSYVSLRSLVVLVAYPLVLRGR